MRHLRHIAAPAAALAVLALGGACSGSDDPGADPSTTPSSGSPTAGTETTDPAEPSDSADAGVAPATGVRLTMPHVSVRAPDSWNRMRALISTEVAASAPDSVSLVSLSEDDSLGSTASVSELGDAALRVARRIYPLSMTKLPTVVVDGVEMYHLAGKVQPLNWMEEFGANVGDRSVILQFQIFARTPPAQRTEIVESVLASLQWS